MTCSSALLSPHSPYLATRSALAGTSSPAPGTPLTSTEEGALVGDRFAVHDAVELAWQGLDSCQASAEQPDATAPRARWLAAGLAVLSLASPLAGLVASTSAPTWLGSSLSALASGSTAQGTQSAPAPSATAQHGVTYGQGGVAYGQETPRTLERQARLQQGVEDMVAGRVGTPIYLSGYHPDWHGSTDHCYSIYFRTAIRQGLVTEAQAEAIMASFPVASDAGWRAVMFPAGAERVAFRETTQGVVVEHGLIPAGHLISMDGNAHVMMSTGRVRPDGRHEVYSFKGGGPETPSWGDSVGYDPQAHIQVVTLEDELEALQRDDQPIRDVTVVEGPSVLALDGAPR